MEDSKETSSYKYTEKDLEVPMISGNIMKIPCTIIKQSDINITEEMNKSGMWKSLEPQKSKEINKM